MSIEKTCPYCCKDYLDDIHGTGDVRETCPHCGTNLVTGKPRQRSVIIQIVVAVVGVACTLIPIRYLIAHSSNTVTKGNTTTFAAIIVLIIGIAALFCFVKEQALRLKIAQAYKIGGDRYTKVITSTQQKHEKELENLLSKNEASTKKYVDELTHRPKCPICSSKANVIKLTVLDRSASTAVFGVASARIGKQWECTACNYSFNVDASSVPYPATKVDSTTTTDPVDELRKYKQLLDDGVITQEDYDQKKKQLLRL